MSTNKTITVLSQYMRRSLYYVIYADTTPVALMNDLSESFKVIETMIDTEQYYINEANCRMRLDLTSEQTFEIGVDILFRKIYLSVCKMYDREYLMFRQIQEMARYETSKFK